MADNVTPVGGGSLTQVPSLSPELRKIIGRTETIANYGTDEGPPSDGAILHAGNWIKPEFVAETLRAEANGKLPVFQAVARTVSQQVFLRWLNVIFVTSTKQANGGDSWDAVKVAYPLMMNDFPAACFTDATLKAARNAFKFFPSCHELAEFLAPYRNDIMNTAFRLHAVANAPTKPPEREDREPWKPTSEEERAKVRKICADLRARPPTPFRASLSPETDRVGTDQTGVDARRDAMARRDPAWAAYLETTRRMEMAREQAEWITDTRGGDTFDSVADAARKMAAGKEPPDRRDGKATTGRQGPDVDWARFMVPLDQPLHGDLRAKYGHPCPGHEQPAVPSDEGEKNDMAPKSNARSFGEGENGPSLSPASDAREGAA